MTESDSNTYFRCNWKVEKKYNSPFLAEGSCKFKDYRVAIKLEMCDLYKGTVKCSGALKHNIGEQHHCKIRGECSDNLKDQLKPLPQFLKEHQKLTPTQWILGNSDGLGKNSRIFANVASEVRQLGRYDNELVKRLLLQQEICKKKCNVLFKTFVPHLYMCFIGIIIT